MKTLSLPMCSELYPFLPGQKPALKNGDQAAKNDDFFMQNQPDQKL